MAKKLLTTIALLSALTFGSAQARRYDNLEKALLFEAKGSVTNLAELGDRSGAASIGVQYHPSGKWDFGIAAYGSFPPKVSYQFAGFSGVVDYNFNQKVGVGISLGGSSVHQQTQTKEIDGIEFRAFNATTYLDRSLRVRYKTILAEVGTAQNKPSVYLGLKFKVLKF